MNNFANIGKSVLLQSIGLQKNYTEIAETTTEVIDYSNTECTNCKWSSIVHHFDSNSELYETAVRTCANCPKKAVTQQTVYKKVYHNEKNRHGYKPMLKSNAIKLLLLLHFQQLDRFGIVKNVDAKALAATLSCDLKTIRNNMDILSNYAYISYARTDTYSYTICLNDYENYYLPANKGGRGFFVLSKELFLQLLQIDNLVSLRIHLRELLELDNLSVKGPFSAVSKTYKDIKQILPSYCKPCVIKEAITHTSGIFHITVNESSLRFEIVDQYNAKLQKQNCYNEYYAKFQVFMNEFNQTVPKVNTNHSIETPFTSFFTVAEEQPETFHLLVFTEIQLEDMARLALQYSYDHVMNALAVIYQTYIMQDRKIHNLGGLLHTVITSNSHILLQAA